MRRAEAVVILPCSKISLRQALTLMEQAGAAPLELSAVLSMVADFHRCELDDAAGSLPLYQRALAIAEQVGSVYSVATAASNMGLAFERLGRHIEARAQFERALVTGNPTDKREVCRILLDLGRSVAACGEPESALQYAPALRG